MKTKSESLLIFTLRYWGGAIVVNIDLIADDFSLELAVINDIEWCLVFLKHSNKTEELGADSKKIVIQRLLSILNYENFPEQKYTYGEKQYARFIALFEKHTFGYARKTLSGVELHFRDKLNEPVITVSLSIEECEAWKNELNRYI